MVERANTHEGSIHRHETLMSNALATVHEVAMPMLTFHRCKACTIRHTRIIVQIAVEAEALESCGMVKKERHMLVNQSVVKSSCVGIKKNESILNCRSFDIR